MTVRTHIYRHWTVQNVRQYNMLIDKHFEFSDYDLVSDEIIGGVGCR